MGTKLTLVVDGAPEPEPPASREEGIQIAQAAWRDARIAHVRMLAALNSAGVLRLHNSGALPSEDGPKQITVYTMSGIAKDLRAIAELATQAADTLMDAHDRLRRY